MSNLPGTGSANVRVGMAIGEVNEEVGPAFHW